MAWDTAHISSRKAELPANWATLRIRVLRRDGYVCQARDSLGFMCGHPANQVDHVERGDNHELDNLQALCRWHHARKSSAEGNAAHKRRPSQKRPVEAHPAFTAAQRVGAVSPPPG